MRNAYSDCYNLSAGATIFYSDNVSNVSCCFYGKNNARLYTIYTNANTTTWNTLAINTTSSLVGASITWTNTSLGGFTNSTYGITVGPLGVVATTTIGETQYQFVTGMTWEDWLSSEYNTEDFAINENGVICLFNKAMTVSVTDLIQNDVVYEVYDITDELLQDFEYIDNGDGTYTLTAWKGTTKGKPGNDIIIPKTGGKVILE